VTQKQLYENRSFLLLSMWFANKFPIHMLTGRLILDFKLSPCAECCMLSFGGFPGVWIL